MKFGLIKLSLLPFTEEFVSYVWMHMLITDMVLTLYLFLIVTHVLGVVPEYSIILNIPISKKKFNNNYIPFDVVEFQWLQRTEGHFKSTPLNSLPQGLWFLQYQTARLSCSNVLALQNHSMLSHRTWIVFFLTPNLYLLNLSIESPLQLFEKPAQIQRIYIVLNLLHYLK